MSKNYDQLLDSAGLPITNMNASWTTNSYAVGDNLHLGIHLIWDNIAPTGTMTLEYSCDPLDDGSAVEAVGWTAKTVTNIDGTFLDLMYLDANLPITAFRLVFQRTGGGSANITSARINLKRD